MRYLLPLLSFLLLGCSAPSGQPSGGADAGPTTETVRYRSGDENVQGFLCRPTREARYPALLLIHDDFGLTDWVKEQAKRFAAQDYVVLAIDLYRGEVVSDLLDAHIMDRGLPEDRVFRDLRAAVDYLVSRKDVRASRLGVVGWDMGGGYALDAAIRDSRLRAVATCYGRLTTDATLLAPLQASVFGVFAGKDRGISPETIEQFRTAMNKADKRLAGIRIYSECGHGFLNPATWASSGAPPAEDVEDAWERIDTYLDTALQQ